MTPHAIQKIGEWLLVYGLTFMILQTLGLFFGRWKICLTRAQRDTVFEALQRIKFVDYGYDLISCNDGFISDSTMPTIFPYYYSDRKTKRCFYITRNSRLHREIQRIFTDPPEHVSIIDKNGEVVKFGKVWL